MSERRLGCGCDGRILSITEVKCQEDTATSPQNGRPDDGKEDAWNGCSLTEKLEIIRENLREIHKEDQMILRRLLEGYQSFLSTFKDTQPRWSSTLPRNRGMGLSELSACAVSTNYRLELVWKLLRQEKDLDIRDISNKLYPPTSLRNEDDPPRALRHSDSASSLEESFLRGNFSYDESSEFDPLSMSSIT